MAATKKGKTGATGKTGKTGPVGPRWRDIDITKMDEKLDKLITAMFEGNGHKAVVERLALIEERLEVMLESSIARDRAIAALSETCGTTGSKMKEHLGKPHIYTLIGNLRFWGLLMLTFVVAHEIYELLHPLVVALIKAWTGVQLP